MDTYSNSSALTAKKRRKCTASLLWTPCDAIICIVVQYVSFFGFPTEGVPAWSAMMDAYEKQHTPKAKKTSRFMIVGGTVALTVDDLTYNPQYREIFFYESIYETKKNYQEQTQISQLQLNSIGKKEQLDEETQRFCIGAKYPVSVFEVTCDQLPTIPLQVFGLDGISLESLQSEAKSAARKVSKNCPRFDEFVQLCKKLKESPTYAMSAEEMELVKYFLWLTPRAQSRGWYYLAFLVSTTWVDEQIKNNRDLCAFF